MSRGPGRVERAIEAILDAEPDNAFTTEDLCDHIYPGGIIEKKHRVAVIRAATSVMRRRTNLRRWRSEALGGTAVFFTGDNVMSYAMARLKVDRIFSCYRNNDPRHHPWKKDVTEEQLLATLCQGGKNRKHVEPGGAWWRHVEMWKAERAGNVELRQKLEAEQSADIARAMAGR